jgi:tRNA(Ile)-lysidine synthase
MSVRFSCAAQNNHAKKKNNIEWREDSSNASDKYLRNKIRHHLVPLLKRNKPQFLEGFIKLKLFTEAAELVKMRQ